MQLLRLAAASAALALAAASRPVSFVHLALSSDPTQMHVQWQSAQGDVLGSGDSTAQWGPSPRALASAASGYNWTWTDSSTGTKRTSNAATMTGLSPGATYFYRVGSELDGWSAVSSFVATRSAAQITPENPLKIAWFGDLGWLYAQSLPYLQTEAAEGNMDHYVHVGDYAYDLNSADGKYGDEFQASIEPITSGAAYMGCEGNHEGAMGFLHYANRFANFAMDNSSGATPAIAGLYPGPTNNHWYSYSVGPVFIAAMSTEAYFFYNGVQAQYEYLDAALAAVDRAVTPWVIVFGHRSIYCSCDTDCDSAATAVRLGPKGDGVYGMETLFAKHKVDLFINGHEHDYERNYAVYQGALATAPSSGAPGGNASAPEVIVNPAAPIYIVEGCAGDSEHHEPFTRAQPKYSAFRSNTYGYGRMTVYNASALLWEQRQTDNEYPSTTGTVIDAMLVLRQ